MALRTIPPTVEPITPEEVRLRLRYLRTDQDAAISDWIKAARDQVERYTERGLLAQTWRLEVHRAPGGAALASPALVLGSGAEFSESHASFFTHNLVAARAPLGPGSARSTDPVATFGSVDLPWAAPLQGIVSVSDGTGAIDPAKYAVDLTVEPARLYWLDASTPSGVTVITYAVGYGDAPEQVPALLRQTVFALVQTYFLFRSAPPPESALDAVLCQADGYRVRCLA